MTKTSSSRWSYDITSWPPAKLCAWRVNFLKTPPLRATGGLSPRAEGRPYFARTFGPIDPSQTVLPLPSSVDSRSHNPPATPVSTEKIRASAVGWIGSDRVEEGRDADTGSVDGVASQGKVAPRVVHFGDNPLNVSRKNI